MDRRQRKTREAIFSAFTDLLRQERYSRITVQQIIERADIGRTTFYSHFETRDDVLRSLCEAIFTHVFSDDPGREKTHDFSQTHGIRASVTHILYHLQEHMDYLPGILTGEGGEIFMGSLRGHLEQLFAPALAENDGSVPDAYLLGHLVSDFAETIRWWSRNARYTPEEVSSFFFRTAPMLRDVDKTLAPGAPA